jgi:hypothetical protein
MTTETNEALVERADAILNAGDLGQLEELCSPGVVDHLPAEVRSGSPRTQPVGPSKAP